MLPHHSDSLVPSCAQHEMIETIHAPLYAGDLHRKDAAGQDPEKSEHCCTVMKSVGNECKSYATSTLLLQGKWEGSLASLVSYTLKLGEGLAHWTHASGVTISNNLRRISSGSIHLGFLTNVSLLAISSPQQCGLPKLQLVPAEINACIQIDKDGVYIYIYKTVLLLQDEIRIITKEIPPP